MFFLLRMAFWLGVVCVLLPSGTQSNGPGAPINATEAVTVATAAVSDMRGFCDRHPEACVAGGKVATALGQRSEAGARTLFELITAKLGDAPAAPAQGKAKVVPVSTRENGTLTATDLEPSWHAPVPLPPRREARVRRPSA